NTADRLAHRNKLVTCTAEVDYRELYNGRRREQQQNINYYLRRWRLRYSTFPEDRHPHHHPDQCSPEDSYSVSRTIDGHPYYLSLTDTAGQEEYRGLWAASNLRSDAFLLVYDITQSTSLDALDYFLQMIDMESNHRQDTGAVQPVKIVAGNKCDLKDARTISARQGLEWARGNGCGFMETSAREMVNIEETFARMHIINPREWAERGSPITDHVPPLNIVIVRRVVAARQLHASSKHHATQKSPSKPLGLFNHSHSALRIRPSPGSPHLYDKEGDTSDFADRPGARKTNRGGPQLVIVSDKIQEQHEFIRALIMADPPQPRSSSFSSSSNLEPHSIPHRTPSGNLRLSHSPSPSHSHRPSFTEQLRGMPPSPRQQRHMSLSQAQIQELLNNPPTAGQADPKFAGRDWQHIAVGELVDAEDVRFVELDTAVEDATNLLTESGAPVLLIRAAPSEKSAVATFDYRDLTQYLLFATGQLFPETDEHLHLFQDLAKKAQAGAKIPLREAKLLGNKEPFVTLPHNADLTAAVELFGGGNHRIVIVKAGGKEVVGILSQLRLVKFLWENGTSFPVIDQLYGREIRELGIGSQHLISINGDRPLKEALTLMNTEGVTSLAVVDNQYNVVGNISNADVKASIFLCVLYLPPSANKL
ncbi:MAG: hypothetical protein Q9217_006948, partial [Psora testacea]